MNIEIKMFLIKVLPGHFLLKKSIGCDQNTECFGKAL